MRPPCSSSSAVLTACAACAALWLSHAHAATALVEDNAALFAPAQRTELSTYHAYLLADHDIDYRVITANGLGDINMYAVRRFAELKVGGPSTSGRGLLLVIDARRDLVRLEVSHSLEGVFPDAFIAYIEHRQMVPFFRRNRVSAGILATTELIVSRVQRAKASAGYAGEAWLPGSGGAGATTRARLGAGGGRRLRREKQAVPVGGSPHQTLNIYFRAMAARNADPELAIYTAATRRMLRGWTVTPAQMDNVVRTYRRCHAQPARFGRSGTLAVIRYPIAERQCAPWFFRKVDGAWALDLTMMQRAIRFGRSNAWHFDRGADHPYVYAFRDWRFDRHGFPRRVR